MKELGYMIAKVKSKFSKNQKETICKYFRKAGMKISDGVNICCNIMNSEPYLISIGSKTTISGGVTLITHDNCVSKLNNDYTDIFGHIRIGNNCFVGMNTTILPGVEIADNVIIGAGSVVTKSVRESNVIVAGVPAKIIGNWENLKKYADENAIYAGNLSYKNRKKLVLESNKVITK